MIHSENVSRHTKHAMLTLSFQENMLRNASSNQEDDVICCMTKETTVM
jgi:hypothetical protein